MLCLEDLVVGHDPDVRLLRHSPLEDLLIRNRARLSTNHDSLSYPLRHLAKCLNYLVAISCIALS